MASFAVHLYGGAVVSSVASLLVFGRGWADSGETQVLFLMGVAGSLLPDIDSDNSTSVRGFFTMLGVAGAFLVSFSLVGRYPIFDLALVWGAVFLLVRYGLFDVFTRFTVHRGIWHSLLGMVFVGLAGANSFHHLGGFPAFDSWLAGAFLALGYLTHLCLDEMASVDLLGNRVRRSFGTALKPFALSSPRATLAMLAAVLVFWETAPSTESFPGGGSCRTVSAQILPPWVVGNEDWLAGLCELLDDGDSG